ncbi:MAG: DUF1018 domain-containing protein [Kiritimatiellales bacterium]|nr:DUF1018 domain-containing protein [Kiritimatiellales bacterium]
MKTIDNDQRRKIFGLAKAAHERSGSSLPLNDWRHRQQTELGIETLSNCPAELGLKLMNRLHQIAGDLPPGSPKDLAVPTQQGHGTKSAKTGPAGGRPKGILEWTGERQALMTKVEALLTDMELPWDYADNIAKRMFGNSVLRVDTLDRRQMTAVITALTKRQQKHGGRRTEIRGQGSEVRKERTHG